MKVKVYIEQYNAYDYLASEIKLAKEDSEAEYELVLNNDDKLHDDELHGLTLVRDGLEYNQVTKMNSFKGVSFFPKNPEFFEDGVGENVQLRLIAL